MPTRRSFRKAAALLHSVVLDHGIVDGNKRLGWAAAVVFLRINGVNLQAPSVAHGVDFVLGVVDGRFRDMDKIEFKLRRWSRTMKNRQFSEV